jgi:enamine deaminase RidA (YjgF/YER057c/UK114 family)
MPKQYINPPGVPRSPYFTRILSISEPSKLIYIAGQVATDENSQPVHVGDIRAQFIAVLSSLTSQLKAAGATWDDVVFRRVYAIDVPAFVERCLRDETFPLPWNRERPSPSTLIGVTALANPDFLVELEIAVVIADRAHGKRKSRSTLRNRHIEGVECDRHHAVEADEVGQLRGSVSAELLHGGFIGQFG